MVNTDKYKLILFDIFGKYCRNFGNRNGKGIRIEM